VTSKLGPHADAFELLLNTGARVKGGRVAANWLPDGSFWFVEGAPEKTCVKVLDPATGEIHDMFDVARIRQAFSTHLGRALPYAGLPFDTFQLAGSILSFTFEGKGFTLDTSDDSVRALPEPNLMEQVFERSPMALGAPRLFKRPSYHTEEFSVPEMPSPDGQRYVGLRNYNLTLHYVQDGRVEQLTHDGERLRCWDVESTRMGMGAGGSIVQRTTNPWSPDGFHIFATRFDRRQVPVQTRTHLLKRYDEVEEVRVARTGDPLPIIEPYVIDVLRGAATRIAIPTEDKFLLFLGWLADGRTLCLALYSRDMREASLYTVDAASGEARLVHHESGETYIRIQHQVLWGRAGCWLLADSSGFLWESEADGWNHLYLFDMDGALRRQLTSGSWPVLDVLGTDLHGGMVYFTAHHDPLRPYDVHFCRIPLSGGPVQRLTPNEGVHEIQLAPDFSSFVATRSTPSEEPRSEVYRTDGTPIHTFPPADISGLKMLGWSAPEQFCVKAADGETDLWGVLFKPHDFDPSKSYPLIEYIYGGPQIVNTPHNFHAPVNSPFSGLHCALPERGYAVVVLDARGTPERSKAFQNVSFKEWRRHVGDDHAAAIKALAKKHSWIDVDRVGLWGHSWGGYHTLACLLDHPDLYRAGVASAPGFEPLDYFIYEPYFGGVPSPQNAAAYRDASLFGDAPNLKRPLMIVAGTSDICPWQNAIRMTNALVKSGVQHELVVLPDETHGYGARQEAYFIAKLLAHFDRELR
jgi:dipeptidyl-peptidase 4